MRVCPYFLAYIFFFFKNDDGAMLLLFDGWWEWQNAFAIVLKYIRGPHKMIFKTTKHIHKLLLHHSRVRQLTARGGP